MADKEKLLKEKQKRSKSGGIGNARDLDNYMLDTFNKDLKGRLEHIGKIMDWQRFRDVA